MYEFIYFRVRDVMTPHPVVVYKDVTLSEVEEIFERHDFNGIPVVDEKNRLVGMMTKLDFLKAFAFTEKSKMPRYDDIMAQKIRTVLTGDPLVVSPETPLTRVAQYMIETKFKSFPVTEDDCVVGIIAREDIMKAVRKAAQGEGPGPGVSVP